MQDQINEFEAEAPARLGYGGDDALLGLDLEITGVHQGRRRSSNTKGFGNLRAKLALRRESQSQLEAVVPGPDAAVVAPGDRAASDDAGKLRGPALLDDSVENRAPLVDVNSQATAQTAASNANRLATGEPDSIDALFERSNQSVAAPTNAATASSVA